MNNQCNTCNTIKSNKLKNCKKCTLIKKSINPYIDLSNLPSISQEESFYLNKMGDMDNLDIIFNYIDSFEGNKKINSIVGIGAFCEIEKCGNYAKYGVLQNIPLRCKHHKELYMHNIISRKCKAKFCILQPSFGYIHNRPIYCSKHSLDNMINVKVRICIYDNCRSKATYRYNIKIKKNDSMALNHRPLFCKNHKPSNTIHIKSK